MRVKILFADDQIPDAEIPDDRLAQELGAVHKDWGEPQINAARLMRSTVRMLSGPRDVVVANTVDRARRLGVEQQFDIAIVDLNWGSEGDAGWTIADAIHQADMRRSPTTPTAIVIYSSRFAEEPQIGAEAANKGWLPFFKVYGDDPEHQKAGQESLRALLSWYERFLEAATPSARKDRERQIVFDEAVEILEQAKRSRRLWDWVTAAAVVVSVALVIAGGIVALTGSASVGIVTSLAGAITGLVPALLFRPLRDSNKSMESSFSKVRALSR